MIHPLKEELIIILGLIIFGFYLSISYDVFIYLNNKLSKRKRINEIIFISIQIYITYVFSYKLSDGYIPIYFILFFIFSWFIYFSYIQNILHKLLDKVIILINKIQPYISKFVINLFYDQIIYSLFKKILINIFNSLKFIIKEGMLKRINYVKNLEKIVNICYLEQNML